MVLSLVVPFALALQVQIQVGVGTKPALDSARLRAARTEAFMEEMRDDSSRQRQPVRRIALTPEHVATAFRDADAEALLLRARLARMNQDSALTSYDAKAYERVSVGLGAKFLGRDRLAFRQEEASRVQWQRGKGVRVELTGDRTSVV